MKKQTSISYRPTPLVSGCKQGTGKNDLPRVAIAGIAIESSTFSPAVTHEEAFRARVGDDVFSYYPFFSPDSGIIDRAVWLPTLRGHAMPGGIVTREAYESLVTKTLDMLKETLPWISFDIHGNEVKGLDDPREHLIVRVRSSGNRRRSPPMDLHGCVSPRLRRTATDHLLSTGSTKMPLNRKKAAINPHRWNGKGKPAIK